MREIQERFRTLCIGAIAIAVIMIAGHFEKQDNIKAMEQYCQLVALHNTDPDIGWPDFRNIYAKQCTPEGQLQPQFYE